MEYLPLAITIFFSASLTIVFKLYDFIKVKTFNAIVVNYFTAATLAFVFSHKAPSPSAFVQFPWVGASVFLAILFISLFNVLAYTAQKIGIVQANIANKTSFVFPILAGILFFSEDLLATKIMGVLVALAAIYFTTDSKKNRKNQSEQPTLKKGSYFWIVTLFIGCGMLDLLLYYAENELIPSEDFALFSGYSFLLAGIIGAIVLAIQLITKKTNFTWRDFLGGLLLWSAKFSVYILFLKIPRHSWA